VVAFGAAGQADQPGWFRLVAGGRNGLEGPPGKFGGGKVPAKEPVTEDDLQRAPRRPRAAVARSFGDLLDDGGGPRELEVGDRGGSRFVVGGDDERRGLTRTEQDRELGAHLVAGGEEQRPDSPAGRLLFNQAAAEHPQRAGLG
jgi:hypothetical protein